MAADEVLVVGAGPTGLTAAIELRRRGVPMRIVDRDPEPTPESRAVGIHPRSLDLLEPCGATERLIAAGVRLEGLRIVAGGERRATVDLTRLPHRFNFILSLPQDRTERILLDVLRERDVEVEQGVAVTDLTADGDDGADVTLARSGDGSEWRERFAWVIGADGAHSGVRKALGIGFPGGSYPFEWSLADVDIADDAVESAYGELRLEPHRPVLARIPVGPGRHRLIGNGPDVLGQAPPSWRIGAVHWQSSFKVSHRRADRLGEGRVWIVGDAAHIHSPVGGRGMNLGIEDAATLAERIAAGTLGTWPEERAAQAAKVIRLSDTLQRFATADGTMTRTVMPRLVGLALRFGPLQQRMLRNVAAI